MGYFKELPNIYYPSPLSNKISSGDLIIVKNRGVGPTAHMSHSMCNRAWVDFEYYVNII